MKNKLIIFVYFLLLTSSNLVLAQFEDIEDLTDIVTDAAEIKVTETEDLRKVDDEENKKTKRVNYKDDNFGYTGGKSFASSPKSRFLDNNLSYFGYDFFIDTPSTYFRASDIPIPSDYIVGPGDILKILLFGNTNKTYTLEINSEGEIYFPEIGPINIAGASFLDSKTIINNFIEDQLIGTDVQVSISNLRSINVFVLGNAIQPGMYTISALSTLTNAIFASGGVSPNGSLRDIQLKRSGKIISSLDFYNLLLNGDTSNDSRLMSGDVVFIPSRTKTIAINGEVARPGIYELKDEENLIDLIKYSGNLRPKANLITSELQRINLLENTFELININLNGSELGNFTLKNGDVLNVYPISNNLKKAILVSGHVKEPGFFSWRDGIRVGDIIDSKDSLLSMADLNFALIKREDTTSQTIRFYQADLEKIFQDQSSEFNLLLKEKDEIFIFPKLLSDNQITTKLIEDTFTFDFENQREVMTNEWDSLTYLRKTIIDEDLSLQSQRMRILESERPGLDAVPTAGEAGDEANNSGKFYEYSIYNYCLVPPKQLTRLAADYTGYSVDIGEKSNVTKICRDQLLEPLLDIVESQVLANGERKVINIFGNVYFPGTYPLTEGMTISDSIKAGGGLRDSTYSREIELIRSSNSGKGVSISNQLLSLSDPQVLSIPLKEMDTINIKEMSKNIRTVTIAGEVFFAGEYPISEDETISQLIDRAGGLTKYASPKAAFFQRELLKEKEIQKNKNAREDLQRKIILSSQTSGLGKNSVDGSVAITEILSGMTDDDFIPVGRLVINLEEILNGDADDIVLEDGDELFIPKTLQSVGVIGEVYVANSHLYNESLNINDYINLSGGMTNYADELSIYLIKSDGSIVAPSELKTDGFFRGAKDDIQPGDTIVVPLNIQPFSTIQATTEITQIIYQMALAAAAVNSF